jgi:DnaJ-domain-containing protein 1
LPEEMMKLATEKTQEIKAAYETVKEARARHAA